MQSRKRILTIAAAIVFVFLAYHVVFKWPAKKMAASRQQQFIEAIEQKKFGRVERLTSENYKDNFDFDRDKLILALRDLRSPAVFQELSLNWEVTEVKREDDAVVIIGTMRYEGTGPAAPYALNYAKKFEGTPFTFRWTKNGILPWSWQLEEFSHPDLEIPSGYVPGDLLQMMEGPGL